MAKIVDRRKAYPFFRTPNPPGGERLPLSRGSRNALDAGTPFVERVDPHPWAMELKTAADGGLNGTNGGVHPVRCWPRPRNLSRFPLGADRTDEERTDRDPRIKENGLHRLLITSASFPSKECILPALTSVFGSDATLRRTEAGGPSGVGPRTE